MTTATKNDLRCQSIFDGIYDVESFDEASLVNIFVSMGQGALLQTKLQHMDAFTDRMHHSLKHLAVECTVHEPLLEAFQHEGVSANYFRASGWKMLPDVSSIRNQDVDTDALLHAHMRTHADALGATISKCCKPRDSTETCPTCVPSGGIRDLCTHDLCLH